MTTISEPKPVRFRYAIKSWGAALFRCRIDSGYDLSHRDLAVRVGVSKKVIKSWEAGTAYPDKLQLMKLYASLRRLRLYEDLLPRGVETPTALTPTLEKEWRELKESGPLEELEDPKTFGEALRLARQVEGLHQDEVGELLLVTGQAVSQWELDAQRPIKAHYDKLLDLFPDLRQAPAPTVQDIEKPGGSHEVPLGVVRPRPEEVAEPPAPPRDLTVSDLGLRYAESLTQRELRRRRVEQLRRELAEAEREAARSAEETERAHQELLQAALVNDEDD